jgi:polar amino acid transport system substrate-binding protein
MNWKKMIVIGALACGAAGLVAGCGGEKKAAAPAADKSAKPTKIVAGMDDTFAPMGFRDDKGEIVGFDIDMAKAVSKEIGIPIEFKPIDWASKETELESGRIDCIWNGFTMTPERQKALAFTKPYMDNVQVYVVLADSAVQKAEELKGKKLSIQESSTAQTLLDRDENLKKSFGEIKAYPDLTACFMDLESGRADAVLADTCLIEYYMTKKPNKFRELPGEVSKDKFSIGIKKVLVDLLNDGIAKVIKNGEAAKISQKWFGKDIVLK